LIIFDTDMDTDCDDAGALALMFEYVKRGRAELLGIIGDAAQKEVPGCCELLCNYYGIKRPIGAVYEADYDSAVTDRYARYRAHRDTLPEGIYYNRVMTRLAGKTDTDYPAAARVYRELLASAADKSVTVVAVGFFTAIENLFATKGDDISELDGVALFEKKVDKVVSMGCADYPRTDNYNFNYNMDRVDAKAFFDLCPVPIYVCPDGADVITGSCFTAALQLGHPLRTIYEIYNGPCRGRSSWDLVSLLWALEPDHPAFTTESHGTVRYDDSCNEVYWQEDGPRQDYALRCTMPPDEMAALLDEKLLGRF
ncbi:MAG: nucleoside hydrolase, partial [Oscillospiraceae bacterium]|nr:nucleoside hydrolase [Oscillospiraceae bacterium]